MVDWQCWEAGWTPRDCDRTNPKCKDTTNELLEQEKGLAYEYKL